MKSIELLKNTEKKVNEMSTIYIVCTHFKCLIMIIEFHVIYTRV